MFGSISVIEMAVSVERKATYPHGRVAFEFINYSL